MTAEGEVDDAYGGTLLATRIVRYRTITLLSHFDVCRMKRKHNNDPKAVAVDSATMCESIATQFDADCGTRATARLARRVRHLASSRLQGIYLSRLWLFSLFSFSFVSVPCFPSVACFVLTLHAVSGVYREVSYHVARATAACHRNAQGTARWPFVE